MKFRENKVKFICNEFTQRGDVYSIVLKKANKHFIISYGLMKSSSHDVSEIKEKINNFLKENKRHQIKYAHPIFDIGIL